MNKTILIIGAGVMQVPLIEAAKGMGMRTVATDRNPKAPGMALADAAEVVDTRDVAGTLEVARRHRVDGVATASDYPVRVAAEVAKALGLPGISPEAALAATDKFEMRKRFREAGVPCPDFEKVTDFEGARRAAESIGYPVVMKPPDKSGSRGVSVVEGPRGAEAAFAHAMEESGEGYIVVERFLRGHEISVETFTWNGVTHIVGMTEKITTGPPYFVEMGQIVPKVCDEDEEARIHDVARRAIAALGVTLGPTHTELMVDGETVSVVEIGARLGGDFIATKLVKYALGVDLAAAVAAAFTGEEPALKRTRNETACIKFLAAHPGVLKSVRGLEAAREEPFVRDAEAMIEPGETVRPLSSSMDRAAYVIACAPTRAEALAAADEAAERIEFDVE